MAVVQVVAVELVLQGNNVIEKLAQWAGEFAKALGYRDPDYAPPSFDPQKYKDELDLPLDKMSEAMAIIASNKPDAEKTRLLTELQKKHDAGN